MPRTIKKSLFIFCFGVLSLPIFLLLADTAAAIGQNGLTTFSQAVSLRRLQLLGTSCGFSAAAAGLSVICGLGVACFLISLKPARRKEFLTLAAASAVVAPYIHALCLSGAVDTINLWCGQFGFSGLVFEGWSAALCSQVAAYLPAAGVLIYVGLRRIDSQLVEAGQVYAGADRAFWGVAVAASQPVIVVTAIIFFLVSLSDYSIPSLFSRPFYSLEIFSEYSLGSRPGQVMVIALPLVAIAALFAAISLGKIRQAPQPETRAASWHLPEAGSIKVLAGAGGAIFCFQQLVLWGYLFYSAGNPAKVVDELAPALPALAFSLATALVTALTCAACGYCMAQFFGKKGWEARISQVLGLVCLFMPGALIGIAALVSARDFLGFLYGNSGLTVYALTLRFWPIAALIVYAGITRQDKALLDAASLYQKNWWQGFARVRMVLLRGPLLAAGCAAAVLALAEVASTIITIPAGSEAVSVRIYNYLHYGASGEVAALSLISALTSVLAAGVIARTTGFIQKYGDDRN